MKDSKERTAYDLIQAHNIFKGYDLNTFLDVYFGFNTWNQVYIKRLHIIMFSMQSYGSSPYHGRGRSQSKRSKGDFIVSPTSYLDTNRFWKRNQALHFPEHKQGRHILFPFLEFQTHRLGLSGVCVMKSRALMALTNSGESIFFHM